MAVKIILGEKGKIDYSDLKEAQKLRYKCYLQMGFIKKNTLGIDKDVYDEKAYHIFVKDDKKVVGTLRIISGKLPLENIFKKEKDELKKKFNAKKVVEISRFAIDEEYRFSNSENRDKVSLDLVKTVVEKAVDSNVELLLIVVHPKYQERYEKYYGMKKYGQVKDYDLVEGNPAVLLYANKDMLKKAKDKIELYKEK